MKSALPKSYNQFLNHFLMVEHLIISIDCSWNVNLLDSYIHPEDVKIVKGLVISRNYKLDMYGWMFTESD